MWQYLNILFSVQDSVKCHQYLFIDDYWASIYKTTLSYWYRNQHDSPKTVYYRPELQSHSANWQCFMHWKTTAFLSLLCYVIIWDNCAFSLERSYYHSFCINCPTNYNNLATCNIHSHHRTTSAAMRCVHQDNNPFLYYTPSSPRACLPDRFAALMLAYSLLRCFLICV